MKFLNKFLNKQKIDDDKVYLKYKNGKVIEYRNQEEIYANEEFDNHSEEEDFMKNKNENNNSKNTKNKILIWIGLAIIIIPLFFLFFKSDINYFDKLNKFMITGKIDEPYSEDTSTSPPNNSPNNPVINENEKEKEDNIKEGEKEEEKKDNYLSQIFNNVGNIDENLILNKISPETLVSLNNIFNANITSNYKHLKNDVNNFYNGRESSYSTNKNLSYKRKIAYEKYKLFLNNEALFLKFNKEDLFLTIRDRYANYINYIDSISTNLNRSSSIKLFNESLTVDNELLEKQTNIIIDYLRNEDIEYTIDENKISIK